MPERVFYFDNLRSALVVLVVLHHVSLVYSALVPFYYVEPPFADPVAFVVLGCFALINQAWFMGALFFVAGYFTPASFERHGAGAFMKSRMIRLGLPTLAFIFLLDPLSRLAVFLMPPDLTGITGSPGWSLYPQLLGLGPLWFAALLLIFSALYTLWRVLAGTTIAGHTWRAPGVGAVTAFTIILALASYLLRIALPLGEETRLVLPFLNFPSFAYLPQYASFFVLGLVAGTNRWMASLTRAPVLSAFALATIATLLAFPAALSGRMFVIDLTSSAAFTGEGSWQSALYAFWDSALATGLGLALLAGFRRCANRTSRSAAFLSRHSYAAYVIHLPVVIYVAYAMRGLEMPVLAKFAVVSAAALAVTFTLAWLLLRFPPIRKVL